MSYRKVALIGIGNILFHDEGLGAYLVKYIEENHDIPDNLTVVEGGTLGFTLMTYYQEYDKIIVVGTGSKKGTPGTVFSESSVAFMAEGALRQTANEVEVTMMLEICSFHEQMGEVRLITMIPEEITEVTNGLTPTILSSMPKLVDTTLAELERSGVVLQKKEGETTMEEVIDSCANPKQTFGYTHL